MEKIFHIASNISTPLSLAGFFAAAFFFTVRQIISRNIFPTLTATLSSDLLKQIIDRFFVLSLVAMVLGFSGFVFVLAQKRPPEDPVQHPSTPPQVVIKPPANPPAAPDPADDFKSANWAEARGNIDWVFNNSGAKGNYDSFRNQGMSEYAAILQAQHNGEGHAADTIRLYGQMRTEKYLATFAH